MMASSGVYQNELSVSLLLLLFFTFILLLLPSTPVGLVSSRHADGADRGLVQRRRVALGSRPPLCVNKCMSCRPCMATLVVSPHQRRVSTASGHEEEDSYYLLAWKCACGDKLFQP